MIKRIFSAYAKIATRNEDEPVLSFLSSLDVRATRYLEVASGLGRFPLLLQKRFPHLSLTCLDINEDLTGATKEAGIPLIIGNILDTDLGKEAYDIVHCSHIIEHFGYPDITKVLDSVFRAVRVGGYVIIRSPLLHPGFYREIDHIRPYPPESIHNYLSSPQQQKIGAFVMKEISRWYRREAFQPEGFGGRRFSFYLNALLKLFWLLCRFPYRCTGYILILRKEAAA